jgi:hypothetical protein
MLEAATRKDSDCALVGTHIGFHYSSHTHSSLDELLHFGFWKSRTKDMYIHNHHWQNSHTWNILPDSSILFWFGKSSFCFLGFSIPFTEQDPQPSIQFPNWMTRYLYSCFPVTRSSSFCCLSWLTRLGVEHGHSLTTKGREASLFIWFLSSI